MAMQETAGSIRAYFIVVGILSGLINFQGLSAGLQAGQIILILLFGLGVVISLAFLVSGVLMPKLMSNGAAIPKAVVVLNALYMLCLIALQMALLPPEKAGESIVRPGIGLLISWYLWNNLSRLSKPKDESPGSAS